MIEPGQTIGILGGGQLGRMTALAALALGYRCHVYCPIVDSPAKLATRFSTTASYANKLALGRFAKFLLLESDWANDDLRITGSALRAIASQITVG